MYQSLAMSEVVSDIEFAKQIACGCQSSALGILTLDLARGNLFAMNLDCPLDMRTLLNDFQRRSRSLSACAEELPRKARKTASSLCRRIEAHRRPQRGCPELQGSRKLGATRANTVPHAHSAELKGGSNAPDTASED